jgi:dolichol-phosphate mannosyltransferase
LKTLIIVPTYNEIENLPIIVSGILAKAPEVNILVADDNSPDGTGKAAENFAANDPRVFVMHRTEKAGLGAAYLAGFAWGIERGYELLVEMDADGSHRPEDLPALLKAAQTADLTIGSRWVKGGSVVNWPFSRKLISRTGNTYANIMLRSGINDMTAGFRAYRTSFLEKLDLTGVAARGYGFQVEMAWRSRRAGAKIVEVPITFVERVHGESKMSSDIVVEALWLVTKWGLGFKNSRK